jgi:plastocyanin
MSTCSFQTITLASALATLLACKGKEAAPPAAAAAENLLRVTASDYAFQAPDSIPAGVTTVRIVNQGPSFHHVQLVKLNENKTMADFLDALKSGPPPAWAVLEGGPNAAGAGDSSTGIVTLEPGNYAVICLIPGTDMAPHFVHGMTRALTVTGPATATTEPAGDDTLRLADYAFSFSQPLTPGHHVIRVENAGQQAHEAVLVKLDSGATAEDIAKWADSMKGTPRGQIQGGVTGIIPGAHDYFIADLTPGTYALLCFFPDMKDGKPHVAHGMMATIQVS